MRVKGWGRFQHFKDRRPLWIKLYRDLLDDIEWHELDGDTAKALVMIWLVAAEDEGNLPSIKELSFRLRIKQSSLETMLTKLEHWLIQDDIKLISDGYQVDALEKEKEKEKEKRREREEKEKNIVEVFDFWRTAMGHQKAALDGKRSKAIESALSLGYSTADLCKAIRGCSKTPWNMGENPNGQRYDGIDLILRDAEKIDRFMRNDDNPPKPQGKQAQIESINQNVVDEFVGTVIEGECHA